MKKPKIKIELSWHWNNQYQITKLVHASRIELNGKELRVGSKTYDDRLVDALAETYDVTVVKTKTKDGCA